MKDEGDDMYIILSPAKNMKFEQTEFKAKSLPTLYEKALPLVDFIKKKSPPELSSLMKINEEQSMKVWAMYQDYCLEDWERVKSPALLTYDGLVFKYLNQQLWEKKSFQYAVKHIGIISGLLGLVRPDDKILPYRLEMQTKLNYEGKNLYQYWQEDIFEEIMKVKKPKDLMINLASKEYSQCITHFLPDHQKMVNIDFKVYRQGKYKVLGTFAKMARGLMARYIIEKRAKKIEDLYDFDGLGYRYRQDLSYGQNLVFVKEDE